MKTCERCEKLGKIFEKHKKARKKAGPFSDGLSDQIKAMEEHKKRVNDSYRVIQNCLIAHQMGAEANDDFWKAVEKWLGEKVGI